MTEQQDRYDAMTFEQLMEELESLTERMAAGEIGIEAAAELYEEAGRLHAIATDRLAQVQRRVDELSPPSDG